MGQPNRHGHGGLPRVPIQAQVPGPGRAQAPPPDVSGKAGVLAGTSREFFLTSLPHPGLTQVTICKSVQWSPETRAGQTLGGVVLTVPGGNVYVITDITFWAQVPAGCLHGTSRRLAAEALSGYVRFDLLFSDRTPMELETRGVCPRAGSVRDQDVSRGWPFLNEVFGSKRVSAWCIYAGENVPVKLLAAVDVLPDFPITLIGTEVAGFSLPRDAWTQIWRAV